jgi:hypothetical protein
VKEDASVDRSDREYIEVLTLLPRLLAMVDPSLPIVLFSSTGRRDVMELLKPYANILTGWEKPRLLTGGGDPAGDAAEQFRSVMLRALRLCHARRMIDELKAASDKESLPKFHSARDTDLPFVEVFVDEGRDVLGEDDPFRVGGVIAFHDNKDRADEFNRALVAQLCWGPTDLEPTIAQTVQLLHKEGFRHDEYESKVFAPAEQMAGSGTLLVGFSLSQPMSARPRWTDDLSSPWCLDNVHRFLVVEALEMALCEFIPSVLHADAFQAAVYVATRDRVKTDADTDVYWQSLPNRYGVRTYRRKDRDPKQPGRDREIDVFQSLSPSDVYPLVSHVRARRAGDMDKVTCLAARGAQLSYGRARLPEESRPRPTHHVADLVARFCLEQNLQRKMPTLYKWLQRGFQSVSDRNLDALLRACREAGDEHFAKALRLACNPLEADRIEEWAKRRVRRSVARVSSSGAEFMSFAAALAEEG